MTILVTGAAGNIGRWVVASLQAMGHPFTAAAHRPAQARTVLGGDVDVRELDLHRPETFPAALEGVSSVFMVWPASLTHAARDMGPLVAYMAQRGGIEQVVYSSVEHADTNPRLPHAQVERLVKEAGLPYTFLRPGYFSQNHETF
ncbi:MAG: NmrA family NAD(P)-binding protein, partial [Chloroflexi bacterium]|nr:NmrA family NAD(P)-binding protein [Chloroflexota bacterium]